MRLSFILGRADLSDRRVPATLARSPPALSPALHPTGASWLNQGERFFATLTQKEIRRGSFTSVLDLILKINRYLPLYNHNPRPFSWTKSDEIFETMYAMCNATSESAH